MGSSTEVQRPEGAAADINLHRRLADALKQAIDEYVTLVAELRPSNRQSAPHRANGADGIQLHSCCSNEQS